MTPDEAVEICTEILEEMIPDLPDRAEDFGDSVGDKISSVRDWIIERNFITEGQIEMIENTRDACLKWLD